MMKESRIVARNRKKWLNEAIKILLEEGPQAVSIKRIAQRLDKSRSPFYRVFGSHAGLLEQMFVFYDNETSKKIFDRVLAFPGGPQERFWYFWQTVIKLNIFRYDYPFRQWSLIDPLVGKFMRKMDGERMDFMRELYQGIGYSEEEADHRTSFAYHEYIGILVTGRPRVSSEWMKRRARFRYYLHTAPPMPEDFKLPLL
ncbi:MAG TPA: TetR/AcrR family transcriptional regulator [bacterium]|nr:TetR/AcrR family transcriptional regulator [bacterium]